MKNYFCDCCRYCTCVYNMPKIEVYASRCWHEPLKGGTYMRWEERGQFLIVRILFLIKSSPVSSFPSYALDFLFHDLLLDPMLYQRSFDCVRTNETLIMRGHQLFRFYIHDILLCNLEICDNFIYWQTLLKLMTCGKRSFRNFKKIIKV